MTPYKCYKSNYHTITTTTASSIFEEQQSLNSISTPIINYVYKVGVTKASKKTIQWKKDEMTNNGLQDITQKTWLRNTKTTIIRYHMVFWTPEKSTSGSIHHMVFWPLEHIFVIVFWNPSRWIEPPHFYKARKFDIPCLVGSICDCQVNKIP
jgi:hypothetical protein